MFFLVTGIWGLRVAFRTFGIEYIAQTYGSIREELKAGWSIFTSTIAINAYTTTRIFVVGLLTNNTLTGYYSIAEKIAGFIQTFPLASFSQAVYPRLSKIFVRSKPRAIRIMQRAQDITNTTGIICLPIIYFFIPKIVKLICGMAYPEVIFTLKLLIFSIFFTSANAFKVQFLLVCGKANTYAKIHIAMASVGLPLLFLLVVSFSYLGAAFATVIIEAGIYTLTFIALRKII
jgi:PST family polysaccharide transporter